MSWEKQYIEGSVCRIYAVISSNPWESWNVSPVDKGRALYFVKVHCGDRAQQVQELRMTQEGWHAKIQGKRKVA